ncbi:hypothetical protein KY348_02055 [Candidatus Woesearchaeota archaeon]|nr:hypothetical protein [Candidatus Woesearchaeota archaeon]
MRKAQAALEFLTTYGWAFIVILIMIGALAYFGVLNPGKMTPNRCLIEPGFDCKDFVMHEANFSVELVNKKGEGLKAMSVMDVISDADPNIVVANCDIFNSTGGSTTTVETDTSFVIYCPVDFSASKGDKVKVELEIQYTLAKGTYEQKFGGSVYGTVQ